MIIINIALKTWSFVNNTTVYNTWKFYKNLQNNHCIIITSDYKTKLRYNPHSTTGLEDLRKLREKTPTYKSVNTKLCFKKSNPTWQALTSNRTLAGNWDLLHNVMSLQKLYFINGISTLPVFGGHTPTYCIICTLNFTIHHYVTPGNGLVRVD